MGKAGTVTPEVKILEAEVLRQRREVGKTTSEVRALFQKAASTLRGDPKKEKAEAAARERQRQEVQQRQVLREAEAALLEAQKPQQQAELEALLEGVPAGHAELERADGEAFEAMGAVLMGQVVRARKFAALEALYNRIGALADLLGIPRPPLPSFDRRLPYERLRTDERPRRELFLGGSAATSAADFERALDLLKRGRKRLKREA